MEEQKLNINLSPEIAEGVYTNFAIIAHSASEFIIDFVRLVPGSNQATVKSRVVMTPDNARNLLKALNTNISNYEKQFGEINIHKEASVSGSSIPMAFGGGEA